MNRRAFISGAAAGAVAGAAAAGGAVFLKNKYGWVDEGRRSFSQQGEDLVLFHALHDTLKIDTPTYIDVGAAHPIRANNTYLLFSTGGSGVLVEPNPYYARLLREHRGSKDKVVEAGIGLTDEKEADYYEIRTHPMLNTFSNEQVQHLEEEYRKQGHTESIVERVVKMPLININRLIRENLGKAPDLLSTDIEGWDYQVIKSLDLATYRPGVICGEGVPMFAPDRLSDLARYLLANDYVIRGGSMANSIFVDSRRTNGM